MTDHRIKALCSGAVLTLGLCLASTGQAQSMRLANQFGSVAGVPATSASTAAPRTVDYVVALVNSEPITNSEVRSRLLRLEQQLVEQDAELPPRQELARQVAEGLINEQVQLQRAVEMGLRVDEAAMLQAEQSLAAQNQLNLEDFLRRLATEGINRTSLREQLRRQILLQQVRERDVQARVSVSESDIDDFVRDRRDGNNLAQLGLNLSHILVRVPEGATDEQIKALQARAQRAADRARRGEVFAELAREYSDAPEAANGGAFGMRPADLLPSLFVEATRQLSAGEIAGPLRSPAGFHVLQLVEKRQAGLPEASVTQTRARHILLRTGPNLSRDDAVAKIAQWREQISTGTASFEAVAREQSQDGSARSGGDLGWSVPGQYVPEFERVMNGLRPGEVSPPTISRFGVHLIQVLERRQLRMSDREQRDIVRGLVREQKTEQALQNWVQDLRARAFVEYREAPQP